MTKQKITDVAVERERQIKSDVQHVRRIAKRAGKIAEHTSTYSPQRTVRVQVDSNIEPATRTVSVRVERSKPKTRTVRVIKSG